MTERPTHDDRLARIAEARRVEREATRRLEELIRAGNLELRESERRLARFDAALDEVRAVLRRAGHLDEGSARRRGA